VEELRKIEADYIKRFDTVNKNIPGRTDKEYYEDNKPVILERKKEYYTDNRDIILQYNKEYRLKNKPAISQRNKEHYLKKKQKLKDVVEHMNDLLLEIESIKSDINDEIYEIDNYIEASSSEDEDEILNVPCSSFILTTDEPEA
jgi:hypothetical protein